MKSYKIARWSSNGMMANYFEIEGDDLKHAVTRNIHRIVDLKGIYVCFPLKLKLKWTSKMPPGSKSYKYSPDGAVNREFTTEEYDRDGYLALVLEWERDGELKIESITIEGGQSDVTTTEPWVIEGK